MFKRHRINTPLSARFLQEEERNNRHSRCRENHACVGGRHKSGNREAFEADGVYRKPNVVKALNRALSALLKQEECEGFKPTNIGGYGSREEIAKLFDEVHQRLDFHEIARRRNRSVGSIVARLIRQDQTANREGGLGRSRADKRHGRTQPWKGSSSALLLRRTLENTPIGHNFPAAGRRRARYWIIFRPGTGAGARPPHTLLWIY
jgi:hypothetical protein